MTTIVSFFSRAVTDSLKRPAGRAWRGKPSLLYTEVNFEEYVARMDNVTDKVTVLDYIPETARVLDYGCGTGPLASEFTPKNYVGYDISDLMVARARKENPAYTFTSTLPTSTFDVVLLSSLLHEVYSYNDKSRAEVVRVLREAGSLLRPGGSIVIRDGIRPSGGSVPVRLRLSDPDDCEKFLAYLKAESPWEFRVTVRDGHLSGSLEEVSHFLMVYTWGWASAHREKEERVNFAGLGDWMSILRDAGLTVIELNVISQEDYFAHLSKLVDLGGLRWETKIFIQAALSPSAY